MNIRHLLFSEKIKGKKLGLGLQPTLKDSRDLELGSVWPWQYQPKFDFKLNPTLSIKNQLGYNSCFHPQTPVLLEDFTFKPIKEIRKGDLIFTHQGRLRKVTEIMQRKWQGTIKKIKIYGDYREIEATGEHPFFAVKRPLRNPHETNDEMLKNEKANFYPLEDLKTGDWVAFPLNDLTADKTIYSFEKDADFLWVLGLYLAEGSVGNNAIIFSLHVKEVVFAEKIKLVMERYGASVTWRSKAPNGLTVTLANKKWIEIFTELGNKICDKKEINKRLMFLEPQLQYKIYEGFAAGDGHWVKKGQHNQKANCQVLVSTSQKLLLQIRTILLRNKIYSSLQKKKERNDRKPAWALQVNHNPPRTAFLRDNFYFVQIKTIKHNRAYHGYKVYNLEVEEDNSYQVNGIAVHNCVAESATVQKEPDEKAVLSTRSLVAYMVEQGVMGETGSNLREGQKALRDFGLAEESLVSSNHNLSWSDFSWSKILTDQVKENAAKHKTKSFWSVSNMGNVYKALDEGRILTTGLNWYSSYNMAGGLTAPWILSARKGVKVGGHALAICGYKKDVDGNLLLIFQNSYSELYGDQGKFYMRVSDFISECLNPFGAWLNLDLDADVGRFLVDNQNKAVKSPDDPIVWLIKGDKKYRFPDLATLYSFSYSDSEIVVDSENNLASIQEAEAPLNFWDGKEVSAIKTIIQQKDNLKSIFKKYFDELFI